MHVRFCGHMTLILLNIHLGMELLNHRATSLPFLEKAKAALFLRNGCISRSHKQGEGSSFSASLPGAFLSCCFSLLAFSYAFPWCLMTLSSSSYVHRIVMYHLWSNVHSHPLPILNKMYYLFFIFICSCYSWTLDKIPLLNMYSANMLSHSLNLYFL